MYCFATLDYFSSCWAGWNRSGPGKDQTARLIDFMTKFLLYGRKEATLAVHFWRHKLMHTSEPRVLRNKDNDKFYIWRTGTELDRHMELARLTDQQYRLDFDPLVFLEDLRPAILGPSGYFEELRHSADLQEKYEACFKEMDSYSVSFKEAGVHQPAGKPAEQAAAPDQRATGGWAPDRRARKKWPTPNSSDSSATSHSCRWGWPFDARRADPTAARVAGEELRRAERIRRRLAQHGWWN
jgi:hypothetical protein